MMSFVDLAGMERTTKTQSKGERPKEAGKHKYFTLDTWSLHRRYEK
jgi:hypothetical protein